jgi:hypothetical protein
MIESYTHTYFKNFSLISSELKIDNSLNAHEMVYSEGQEPYMLQHK